jgi:hypothetical protein
MVKLSSFGATEVSFACQKGSSDIRPGTRFAQRRTPRDAGKTTTAYRHVRKHDVIALFQIGHPTTDLPHDPAGLVSKHEGHNTRARSVNHRQVRMAKTSGGNLDQYFAILRSGQLQFFNGERPRDRIRRR